MKKNLSIVIFIILLDCVVNSKDTYTNSHYGNRSPIDSINGSNSSTGSYLLNLTKPHGNVSGGGGDGGDRTKNKSSHGGGIHIFKVDFQPVSTPFIVCVWVLIASVAKIGFHHYEWLSSTIPESCLLILLGIPIGFILNYTGTSSADGAVHLTSSLFFFFLLPPIILDAGYFMTSEIFYLNIGTILLYAVLGTIFNTFAVGASVYGVSHVCDVNISLLHSLVFGSLISAVDPVAVLAVFEEVHVNEVLYMLVFGESVLNDAASVVLYRTFESLSEGNIDAEQVGLAFASFFVVSIGGTIVGVIFALAASFTTRFTDHVLVIEPIFVFLMSYLAYLSAEVFHFSGIMSILFCGIVMKPYVESNVSRKSHTTIKYFLKLLSSSCESIIFMFLGVSLVQSRHQFNFTFIMFTLLFITIYRAVGITLLTGFANRFGRLSKVKKVEQFIMSYGGLRGAVAFCLAILLKDDGDSKLRETIVTTTISVVIFTVFVQGCTIKKLVNVLGVKKSQKRDKSMGETLNERVLSYTVAGVEEIIGVHGHGFWMNMLEMFNRKYLRRWLEREPDLALDEEMIMTQRRIAFKTALSYADKPNMIAGREQDGVELAAIKANASMAMQFAMKAQQTPGYDGGFLDVGVLNANASFGERAGDTGNEDSFLSEAFNTQSFNSRAMAHIIPKATNTLKRRSSTRKYTLESLEEGELFTHQRRQRMSTRVAIDNYHIQSSKRSHHHHHRHKNGKLSEDHGNGEERHSKRRHHRRHSKAEDGSHRRHERIPEVIEEMEVQTLQVPDTVDGEVVQERVEETILMKEPIQKASSQKHHHHHHHHSKHKHKNRRKESEALPQMTDAEEPVRDVKSTYDFPHKPDYESTIYDFSLQQDYESAPSPLVDRHGEDVSIQLSEPSHTNTEGGLEDIEVDVHGEAVGDVLLQEHYVPELPAYHDSPSKKFSPYADTPLLDRSRKEMNERDKEVLMSAKRKHSTINNSNMSDMVSHGDIINGLDSLPASPPVDVAIDIVDPWSSNSSPPHIILDDHHIDNSLSRMSHLDETNL